LPHPSKFSLPDNLQQPLFPLHIHLYQSIPNLPDLLPVILSGILSIYGLVVSVLISSDLTDHASLAASFMQLGAGLSVGLSGLAAGFAIGIVGDAGVRGVVQQPRIFVSMVLILIMAEVLGISLLTR
jgi:V-type H+-transporting ATPase 16kDa proteolipid subunit